MRGKAIKFENEFKKRQYPLRHLFVILDGQDLGHVRTLKFSYEEVNTRLCKIVPQKIWNSTPAQRMDLYQRVELSKPSAIMMKQNLLEILDEVNKKLDLKSK